MNGTILTVKKKEERTRVMAFAEGEDVIAITAKYRETGWECTLKPCEVYMAGEEPPGLPWNQQRMLLDFRD